MKKFFRKNRKYHRQDFSRLQTIDANLADEYAKIGRIVERVNFVELRINQIIAEFYISPNKQNAFLEDFMFAGRLRLNDKLKIFKAILRRKNISFDEVSFEHWIHIRNMVAHGVPSKNSNSRRAILHFNGNIYDIENEFRDFERLQVKMEDLVNKIR